ncbi:MAG TPA: HDOD domain-containing protein [Terriglobales bacterium]|nr:HDOD domain-containing protein [Terriglobales bacterium]
MSTATMTPGQALLKQIDNLGSIPSIQAIVQPLIGYFQQPLEDVDTQRIIDLVSHDSSLTAQCLHMANSPLFSRWQSVSTTRAAVMALGLQRMREIVLSCCMLKMIGEGDSANNPIVFWEHSLACALVCRKLSKRIGMQDSEQAYLAGLLHDIGFVVNLQVAPERFMQASQRAQLQRCSMDRMEDELMGFNHCESGKLLAQQWKLNPAIMEVISYHHRLSALADYPALVALVNLADRLCRLHGLGYGFPEDLVIDWNQDEIIGTLSASFPNARIINWQLFYKELETYLKDVRKLVQVMFRF